MWENLKKAWNVIKAGTLAVGAWIEEISSSGDMDKASTKFTRKYNQKILEYSAGDRLGSTAARIVRGGAGLFNNIADTLEDIISDTPAPTTMQTRYKTNSAVKHDKSQGTAELAEKQEARYPKMEQRHDQIRTKYGIEKNPDIKQKKFVGSWKEKDVQANPEATPLERSK